MIAPEIGQRWRRRDGATCETRTIDRVATGLVFYVRGSWPNWSEAVQRCTLAEWRAWVKGARFVPRRGVRF